MTTEQKKTILQTKHRQLMAEWNQASKDEQYWIGLEIESLESKIAAL